MHTYKINKVLDFKVMGQNGYDQTACLCLARDDYAAEGHSRIRIQSSNLANEQEEPIRTNNTE